MKRPVGRTPVTVLVCAWCLAEQGIRPQEESHGICERHAEEMVRQFTESRKGDGDGRRIQSQ